MYCFGCFSDSSPQDKSSSNKITRRRKAFCRGKELGQLSKDSSRRRAEEAVIRLQGREKREIQPFPLQ